MKTFLLKNIFFFICSLLLVQYAGAQKKLLILGSSTSTCFFGPSSVDSCYVTRLRKFYQDNDSPIIIDNRAVAGDNCYQGMPITNTPPPADRNSPRPYNNITEGLQGNPDVVLINYPSNGYDIFSIDEVLYCLRTIKQTANSAGKPCYITTSQPRNDPESFRTEPVRMKMAEIKNRILSEFGSFAINFWDGIANPVDNSLLSLYDADGTHLNNAGHRILFNRVLERNIFSTAPTVGNGLNYKYYEGNWSALPNFNELQPAKSGSTANVDVSPKSRDDYFAFLWEGFIKIPTPGNYTFEVVSDDGGKLYFNSLYDPNANALVNNDGLHPAYSASASININAAGSYPIAISFFENSGGEVMQVYWSGPGFSRQPIPNEAFSSQPTSVVGNGLKYKYYEGNWSGLPDFNSLQPAKTGSIANIDISPRSRDDYFAFLWEGYIKIPTAGNYIFELISDDGSKLYFNTEYNAGANALVNNDGLHPAFSASGSININAAGSYPIAISFFENSGGEIMQVYWSGPGFSRQLIPNEAFSENASPGLGFANKVINTTQPVDLNTNAATMRNPTINTYPNPFTQSFDISLFNNNGNNNVSAGLYDISGKLIHVQNFKNIPAGYNTLKMNLKDHQAIADGVYFLKVDINGIPYKVLKLLKAKS
ncbi:MAG: PA14 domain-containing protein [Chitinophagaceae bacterium]